MQSAADSPGTIITKVFNPAQFITGLYLPWQSAGAFLLAEYEQTQTLSDVILAVCMFQKCVFHPRSKNNLQLLFVMTAFKVHWEFDVDL